MGWTKGDTSAIDYRWIGVNPALAEKTAVEVVALAPDVLLASSNDVIASLEALKVVLLTAPLPSALVVTQLSTI